MTLTAIDEASSAAAQPHVTVLTDRCAGCQECVIRCPSGALAMDADRWVAVADDALCVGCRQCERTCPFSAITVEGPLAVTARTDCEPQYPGKLNGDTSEVRPGFDSWDQALAEASRCLECPDPTCVRGCPAHNDIPSFIAAIHDGDLSRAHEVLRRTSVLPDICSRVCDQAAQCEGACTWSLAGGTPVAIGKLERFVADHAPVPPPAQAKPVGTGLSVAVVGSGPAGIGAAWELVEEALGVNDVILLRTRGRRTGQVREVLVAYVELGGVLIVCGGNAGWDTPPGWFENLRDGGPIEIEYRDHHRTAVTPVIRTTRPFPVVRLEPLEVKTAGDGATERSALEGSFGARACLPTSCSWRPVVGPGRFTGGAGGLVVAALVMSVPT
jgi:ferredoxin